MSGQAQVREPPVIRHTRGELKDVLQEHVWESNTKHNSME